LCSTSVPTGSPRGEDECAAVGGLTWRVKAAGSHVSRDSPEVGAGTVGWSRPSLGPVTAVDSDSGEPRWTVREAASPWAAVVGPAAGVLSFKGFPGPIVHPPDSACDECPVGLKESVALPHLSGEGRRPAESDQSGRAASGLVRSGDYPNRGTTEQLMVWG